MIYKITSVFPLKSFPKTEKIKADRSPLCSEEGRGGGIKGGCLGR